MSATVLQFKGSNAAARGMVEMITLTICETRGIRLFVEMPSDIVDRLDTELRAGNYGSSMKALGFDRTRGFIHALAKIIIRSEAAMLALR